MATRKIVAIGGGESGRRRSDGTVVPNEQAPILRTIITLCEKPNPNLLLLAHAQPRPEKEENYLSNLLASLGTWQLPIRCLRRATLADQPAAAHAALQWADIIYEGGGDTTSMLKYWHKTGFSALLREAQDNGKVLCGVSAGANCWFSHCSSKAGEQIGDDPATAMRTLDGLGFLPGFFVPHCNVPGRIEHMRRTLCEIPTVGIALSDCAALVIEDDSYRLITGKPAREDFSPYALRAEYCDGKYLETQLPFDNKRRPLDALLG